MINRQHRFHGYNSLTHTYRHGKNVRSSVVMLRFAKNPRRKDWRAAVVVSRKVHKSAVVRNRIRRRIYEAVRLQSTESFGNYDMVFTVFDDRAATIPAEELSKCIAKLLEAVRTDRPQ